MPNKPTYVPFSQRNGLASPPPQFRTGEVPTDLRRLLHHYVKLELDRNIKNSYSSIYFDRQWLPVVMDFYVLFKGLDHDSIETYPNPTIEQMRGIIQESNIGRLFDFVEFLARHPACSPTLVRDLRKCFEISRAAYRLIDGEVVAIGSAEQGQAFKKAIVAAEAIGAEAARAHLISAGTSLRNGDWAGSVRESIHAVEAMSIRLAPGTTTLGPALAALEKRGHVHGGLKAAFGALYGYSSDEEGVRHALVFQKEAQVDEADALFMLGACASFVSYLISRSN